MGLIFLADGEVGGGAIQGCLILKLLVVLEEGRGLGWWICHLKSLLIHLVGGGHVEVLELLLALPLQVLEDCV